MYKYNMSIVSGNTISIGQMMVLVLCVCVRVLAKVNYLHAGEGSNVMKMLITFYVPFVH